MGAKLHMDRTAVTPLKEFVVNFQKKKNVALANLHMDRTAVTPGMEFVVNIQLSDWKKSLPRLSPLERQLKVQELQKETQE